VLMAEVIQGQVVGRAIGKGREEVGGKAGET